jgi:hypothetical protein
MHASAANSEPARESADPGFEHPQLKALHALWCAKARDTGWPSRRDFDARALKPFLTNISIAERVTCEGRRRYRYRLVGSAIVELFGEATGRHLDELLKEPFLARWTANYDAVFAVHHPLRFTSRFELPFVNYLDGESFAVSLSNGGAAANLVLTASYFMRRE